MLLKYSQKSLNLTELNWNEKLESLDKIEKKQQKINKYTRRNNTKSLWWS